MRFISSAILSALIASTAWSQAFQWPVTDPVISGSIGHDYAAFNHIGNQKYHVGPDIVSQSGDTTVYAFADGVVVDTYDQCLPCNTICGACECNTGCTGTPGPDCDCSCGPHNFGNYVIIHHQEHGIYSMYAHLNSVDVLEDDEVDAGDPIGKIGSTGYSCGVHLHFEVRDFLAPCSSAGVCGYSIDVPDGKGYLDPRLFILPPFQEVSITPVVVEVIAPANLNVQTGPGTAGSPSPDAYAVLTKLPVGRRFVAYKEHGGGDNHWYRIDLPNAAGPVHGWAPKTFDSSTFLEVVPSGRIGRVVGVCASGAPIHLSPDSGTYIKTRGGQENIKVWDGQWLAIVDEQSVNGEVWYQVDLPLSAEPQTGWLSGDFIQTSQQPECGWSALGTGLDNGGTYSPGPKGFAVCDFGSGPALYVGGYFATAGGASANNIAKWDGSSWSPLGAGMTVGSTATDNPMVRALSVFDDGTGAALYAGGSFITAGGATANNIAKWDGSMWAPLGTGVSWPVNALAVFDDGGGPALYAGGVFTTAGGVSAKSIARWDGSTWSPLGSGLEYSVWALTVFDDGAGPALYAGGRFFTAGGLTANKVAKWDGSTWTPLGSGIGTSDATVNALSVFDDGNGPALYAGGNFTTAGGVSASSIAKWDGTSWSALGTGMNNWVYALTVFDDGGGPALYAGGYFTSAGGVSANRIAKWDGTSWSPLGSDVVGGVFALSVFDDGAGSALYAQGAFGVAGGVSANNIARWYCPPPICGDNQVNQPGEECDGTDDTACPGECQPDCRCFSCSPDADGDGVTDPVDPNPDTFGGAFEDLTNGIAGTIGDRGNQVLCVTDVPPPGGVKICSLGTTGGGCDPAEVTAYCLPSFFKISTLQTGNCVELSCGNSITATAIAGDVAGELELEGGVPAGSLILPEGNAVTFDGATLQISASLSNTTSIVITENSGNQVSLAPGTDETLAIEFGTSRYMGIAPSVNFPGALGGATSIQVRAVDIDDALGQDAREGEIWWAGASQSIPNAPNGTLNGAQLLCEATPSNAEQWPSGVLHLFGAPIVAGSAYEVRTCDVAGANCSGPLTVSTGKWGDVVSPFGGLSQPNFGDISAILDKFRGVDFAPDTPRVDLVGTGSPGNPNIPNQIVNFSDVSAGLDAFRGIAFPYTVPACP
jgi:murein DD-endopeptidase MepM/ murein hydrolase activator NlpD